MRHLEKLPYVCIVTEDNLENLEWEPPFESGSLVVNTAYHGDENTPHIHMPFVPYSRNMKRGIAVQNVFA